MGYIKETCGKGKPGNADVTGMTYAAGMALTEPHGHHVVMKGNRFPLENALARNILCKHGINPYVGCENLVYSQNWCHSEKYAKKVLAVLKEADKGGRVAVEEALVELAKLHRTCDQNGLDTTGKVLADDLLPGETEDDA